LISLVVLTNFFLGMFAQGIDVLDDLGEVGWTIQPPLLEEVLVHIQNSIYTFAFWVINVSIQSKAV